MASKQAEIPEFQATSVAELNKAANTLRSTFRLNKTKDVQWRIVQLRKLYWGLKDNEALLQAALHKDLRKCAIESHLSETDMVLNECVFMQANLERFTKDQPVDDIPLTFKLTNPRVRREPLGMALIIGAYNFPIQLSILPLIGAIAAGCTAVLKPSENAPACAMVLKSIIEQHLDNDAFFVVNGGVAETTALLDQKWDKIFYTGGLAVGKIIAKKAAENLTPVTLELGGLNPAFVTKNADIKLAARRLLWSKTINAGQVCLSQNYILVEKSVLPQFIEALKASYKDFFPNGAKTSQDYSRIINQRQFLRMKKMLDDTSGKIILGGEVDEDDLFIEPTVVLVDSTLDPMMRDESFGPIFSVMAYDTLDEAITTANSVCRTPLGLYSFGSDQENQKVLNGITSGGATLNDAYFHASIPGVPFGGVGESGYGAYHGKSSLDNFSHLRSIAQTPGWMDKLLRPRYMPYSFAELKKLHRMAPKPDFDRSGKQVKGVGYVAGLVFGLGAKTVKGALLRWILVLASMYALTFKKTAT